MFYPLASFTAVTSWPCFQNSPVKESSIPNLLVRAKRRVAGWVAGGCWDDEITVMTGIIPENSLRLAPGK